MPIVKFRIPSRQGAALSGIKRRNVRERSIFDPSILPRYPSSDDISGLDISPGEAPSPNLGSIAPDEEGSAEANLSAFGTSKGIKGIAEQASLRGLSDPITPSLAKKGLTNLGKALLAQVPPENLAQISLNPLGFIPGLINKAVPYAVTAKSLAEEIESILGKTPESVAENEALDAVSIANEDPTTQAFSGILSNTPTSKISRAIQIARTEPKTIPSLLVNKAKQALTPESPEAIGGISGFGPDVSNAAVDAAMGSVGPNAEAIGPDVSNAAVDAAMGSVGPGSSFGGNYGGSSSGGPGVGGYGGGVAGEAGGAAGGGEGTVLCTVLYQKGVMPKEIYEADSAYGKKLDPEVLEGYHLWAIPLAGILARSDTLKAVLQPFILAWGRQMAYKEGVLQKPNRLGKIIEFVGIPFCRLIGTRKKQWRFQTR